MHKCSGTTANIFIAKTVYATNLLHEYFSSKCRSESTQYPLSIHSVSSPQVASMRLILVLLLVACLFALIADSRRKPQKKPSKKPPKKPSKPAKKPGRPAKPGKIAFFLFHNHTNQRYLGYKICQQLFNRFSFLETFRMKNSPNTYLKFISDSA